MDLNLGNAPCERFLSVCSEVNLIRRLKPKFLGNLLLTEFLIRDVDWKDWGIGAS